MKTKQEWIEIFPYGVTLDADQSRPMMLFKDENQQRVLPVWLSQLDAGIAVHQNSEFHGTMNSPYQLTWKILKPLEIFLRKCYFTDVKNNIQYVELLFEGHPKLKTLKCRADEAVSFCLSTKTKFYCREDYFGQCRVMEIEQQNFNQGPHKASIVVSKNTYMN